MVKSSAVGYITDELTDMSIDWLDNRKQKEKPFFMYVSHKGVHSDFVARDEDRGIYKINPGSRQALMQTLRKTARVNLCGFLISVTVVMGQTMVTTSKTLT